MKPQRSSKKLRKSLLRKLRMRPRKQLKRSLLSPHLSQLNLLNLPLQLSQSPLQFRQKPLQLSQLQHK